MPSNVVAAPQSVPLLGGPLVGDLKELLSALLDESRDGRLANDEIARRLIGIDGWVKTKQPHYNLYDFGDGPPQGAEREPWRSETGIIRDADISPLAIV
ncbi:MAG: hypothetical protein MMC33_007173 [Icmadophila ericetorum]|nr:hypothetical protein [Icmadophila ericetorum]